MMFEGNVGFLKMGEVDRISELPDVILHAILLMLDTKEASRASVLSKRWYEAWSSISVLDFWGPSRFSSKQTLSTYEDNRQWLMRFIDKTMERYFTKKYRITKMYLDYLWMDDKKVGPLVDKWMMIAVQNQIQILDINVGDTYTLPEILFSSKSLKYLKCRRVELPYYETMELKSLKHLILVSVVVDIKMFKRIMSFCPLIELDISHFYYINIPRREVSGPTRFNIQGSQLQKFVYRDSCNFQWPFIINVVALKNLRALEIDHAGVTDDIVSELVYGLVALESLVLNGCPKLKCIKISSISLKKLGIYNLYYYTLTKVTIDAPHLHDFYYDCKAETPLSLIRVPDQCNAQFHFNVHFHQPNMEDITNDCFVKLKKFLIETNIFKSLVVDLSHCRKVEVAEDQLRNVVSGAPYKLRVLKLREISQRSGGVPEESSLVALLDGLFWCCHPDVVSITTGLQNSIPKMILSYLAEKVGRWNDPLKSIEVGHIENPRLVSKSPVLEIRLRLSW